MLVNSPEDFSLLQIGLAAPDRIRFWSYGEVEKPETINYRTFKPERRGLFCEKIFGPVKDWECSCGKYRRVRYRGIVCERCGVEVTHSKVRRERMGHLELAAPVSHIWFLKGIPSFMGLLLDMSSRQLEEVIYYDSYIVTEASEELGAEITEKQLLTQSEYYELKEKHGKKFDAKMGAEAIKEILAKINLSKEMKTIRKELSNTSGQKRLKLTKRLRIIEGLHKSGNKPQWMILDAIPVMPPDLRPMVQLEGGRFATSDLNDLYRRVVNRNNRLKRLMDIGAPEMIVRNEKRMLQEAVDVLISNGKRGRSVTGSNGRPLKSLGNIIEGKQGRFRQNLLGKRVDYSARSVIVVGPHLKFHQCGLPKEMALELFKPFVIRKLVENGVVSNVKSAKRKIENRDVVVWDILENVIKGQLVLLNRAPTLHRLGIQAFEPKLVEGSAIQVHPLVCTAFNADFDGDQMAVHLPLSIEAQTESRLLILSTNNILSPSSGKAIITPSQDMILGCYFLTVIDPNEPTGKEKIFSNTDEAWRAWEAKVIGYHTNIKVRIKDKWVKTTMGRIIFNRAITDALGELNEDPIEFINKAMGKKQLGVLIQDLFIRFDNEVTAKVADSLKHIGFKYSTLSGISISLDDMKIPDTKEKLVSKANDEVEKLAKLQRGGKISKIDRQLRSNDIWRAASAQIANDLGSQLGALNNLFIMANSGARGNMDQVRQLAGMRGLMSDAQGRTVNIPIKSSFKEGLNLTEYFISCYGARKGLVDTALRTADSGYLTRRLVDVAQDVMISCEDCETENYVEMEPVKEGFEVMIPLTDIITGRFVMEDVQDGNDIILKKGELITQDIANKIEQMGTQSIKTRSLYRCQAERGICQKCYGTDLSTGRVANIGEAIGIIAAQSIGEPGTQLTMRTFHTGGVDLRQASQIQIKASNSGKVTFSDKLKTFQINQENQDVVIVTKEGFITVGDGESASTVTLPEGAVVAVSNGDTVKHGQLLADYDPTYEYVVSEGEGTIKFIGCDIQESKNENNEVTDVYTENDGKAVVFNPSKTHVITVTGSSTDDIVEGQILDATAELGKNNALSSSVLVQSIKEIKKSEKTKKKTVELTVTDAQVYPLLLGSRLYVADGDKVTVGQIIAKERMGGSGEASKTKDIVQGLPRVEELFEARRPKDAAVLSDLDGIVNISDGDGYRSLTVVSDEGLKKENKIPYGVRITVFSGKRVNKGDMLTEGVISPHDLMDTKGVVETQKYLTSEVLRVYQSQGVQLNSKHVEVIVRQMTRKVIVTEMGDTDLVPNDLIDIRRFERKNTEAEAEGNDPAQAHSVLLGITRASLNTESFISASSFQQTASVLTKAAVEGQVDPMYGLKENVIIGKLIPAGTGFSFYNRVSLDLPKSEESSTDEEELIGEDTNKG